MRVITAHSGSDATPDNSLEFLHYFLGKPYAQSLEVDVQRNDQEQFVLAHEVPKKGQAYLLLKKVFQLFQEQRSQLQLNCDLKQPGSVEAVWHLANQYGCQEQVVFSGYVELDFIKKHPAQVYVNLENFIEPTKRDDFCHILSVLGQLKQAKAQIINLNEQWYTPSLAEVCAHLELACSLWTVNDLEKIRTYEQAGVYNITTRAAHRYYQSKEAVLCDF